MILEENRMTVAIDDLYTNLVRLEVLSKNQTSYKKKRQFKIKASLETRKEVFKDKQVDIDMLYSERVKSIDAIDILNARLYDIFNQI